MARNISSRLSSTVMIIVAAAAFAGGEETPVVVTTTPGQQQRNVTFGAAELRLTLRDAVGMALAHNINLEVSRLGLASAEEGVIGATGIFDPAVTADASTSFQRTPTTNQLQGAQVNEGRRQTFNLGLGWGLLPTGAQASVAWDNTRTVTNSSFYYLNPSYDSGFSLSLTQPLLRGFGTDVNRSSIEVARRNGEISRLQFEGIVITTLQQVENAYWNLVFTIEDLKVKQQSLKLAQDLLDQTRTRVRIGTSAPIDIVQSEATVAAREQEIILAENAVAAAADVLKGLMGFETSDDWNSHIIPVDELQVAPAPADLASAVDTALHRRVDLKQEELTKAIQSLNLLVAENQVRPKLNLVLGYGLAGVGGTLTTTDQTTGVTTVVPGGWNDALDQLTRANYDQWSAAINFALPLGNHQAKAQRAQARFQLRSVEQTLAALRQSVIQDVRNSVRGLEAGSKSIDAAVKARVLAERNLDAEQKKFANGMSTNYQVLKIQDDLAAAMAAELQSRVGYRQAKVGYDASTGTLLDVMGIELRDEEPRREPHTLWRNCKWLQFGHWISDEEPATQPAAPAAPEKEQSK